jgi:hypothetical protein
VSHAKSIPQNLQQPWLLDILATSSGVLCVVRAREHETGKLQFYTPKSHVELYTLRAALPMLTSNLHPNTVHSANIKYKFLP